MKPDEFISMVVHQVAESAVGPSALRNQGASGLLTAARKFFKTLDLGAYGRVNTPADYRKLLDTDTKKLQEQFPPGARNWGTARKAVNLFLRDACYNIYLSKKYELDSIVKWLEVPLDNDVGQGLIDDYNAGIYRMLNSPELKKWPGLKHLDKEQSDILQKMAQAMATAEEIDRVHLDLRYWRRGTTGQA